MSASYWSRAVREDQHGTGTGYSYGCRCDACSDAQRVYASSRRKRTPMEVAAKKERAREKARAGTAEFAHGTTGYTYWGCRCDVCVAVSAARGRAWRQSNSTYSKERGRRARSTTQALTLPGAHRTGRRWTAGEDAHVMRDDMTHVEIALLIGRTRSAVDTRAFVLRQRAIK